jgi:hypothetical protein
MRMIKMTKYKYDETLIENILILCKKLGRIPTNQEILDNKIVGCVKIIKSYCDRNGLKDWRDICRENGYGSIDDLDVNGLFKSLKELNYDDVVWLYKYFIEKMKELHY